MRQGCKSLEYGVCLFAWACLGLGLLTHPVQGADDAPPLSPPSAEGQFAPATPVSAQPQPGVSAPYEQSQPEKAPQATQASSGPEVRLVAIKTDVAKRYKSIVPPLPVPPFTSWRKWLKEHEESVHCVLEWRDDAGRWWHGELRSTNFDDTTPRHRVGWGEFPGTGYDAYGVFIIPGRVPRDKDSRGRPLTVTLDEELSIDYQKLVKELCGYAAKNKRWGEPGTGGTGERNVGLGGPAYKPSQNSNTMVNYVLRRCGLERTAPAMAVGWDTKPHFPYSSNVDAVPLDTQP